MKRVLFIIVSYLCFTLGYVTLDKIVVGILHFVRSWGYFFKQDIKEATIAYLITLVIFLIIDVIVEKAQENKKKSSKKASL